MGDFGWNYLSAEDKAAIARGVRDGVVYGGPYHVEIYPADRCNIDCFFCSTAAIRGTDELPQARFDELLQELRASGTRAIRLAGGGEPLFHRRAKDLLRSIIRSGIPLENITTNAVLLDAEVADLLLQCCDHLTVSLNTGEARSYAEMMQTTTRNFERVLTNVTTLLEMRKLRSGARTTVTLQFLVWKGNYKQIPAMYELATRLQVDNIIFGGLAFLRPEQHMTDGEVDEMLKLYESVIRQDEFRKITTIDTFERNLRPDMIALINRLAAERQAKGFLRRVGAFARRSEPIAERFRHHWKMRQRVRTLDRTSGFRESCIIGWFSMMIRSDGTVGPCCMLQHKELGNIFRQPVAEIWQGPAYQQFRAELSRIIAGGESWQPGAEDATVEHLCAVKGTNLCPIKSHYYIEDPTFVRELDGAFSKLRAPDQN